MRSARPNKRPTIDIRVGSWAILSCLLLGSCLLAADADERVPRPLGAPPEVVPLPDEWRRTFTPRSEDYYLLRDVMVLQGGEWAVGEMSHFEPNRAVSDGWLAVELRTGRSICLKPPKSRQLSKDAQLGRTGFHDRLCSWRTGSCAVGVKIVSEERVKNATPEARIAVHGMQAFDPPEDEQWFLWQWRPANGSIEPLDWYTPVESLTRALEGTPYSVRSWTERFSVYGGWSGDVQIRNDKTGKNLVLKCPDAGALTPKDTFVFDANGRRDFGPTDNPNAVVVLDRLGLDRGGTVLSSIDLADGLRARWQHDRKALEKILGDRVRVCCLIHGPKHPCRYLPMVLFGGKFGERSDRPIWVLDAKTGRLTGPHSVPGGFSGPVSQSSFLGRTAYASDDGRLLSYETQRRLGVLDEIIIYDTTRGKVVARREPRTHLTLPVGFDAAGNVILADTARILRWSAPFTGDWEVLFTLEK